MEYETTLQARFYDPAERLYVEDGLSPRAVSITLKEEHGEEAPSRRTIYNWAEDGDWAQARRKFHQAGQDIQEGLIDAIRMAVKEAIANPNRDTFSALKNAMKSAEMFHQLRGMEQAVTELEGEEEAGQEQIEEAAYEIVRDAVEG